MQFLQTEITFTADALLVEAEVKHRASSLRLILAASLLLTGLPPQIASATTRVYYTYDAKGRLARVCNAAPGDGELTNYALDSADNRQRFTNVKTDGALFWNSGFTSADGRFTLWMQPDGNLVLYRNSDGFGLWSTNTVGSGATVAYFQSDGNFVMYNQAGQGVWHSATYMYPCGTLNIGNDGNVTIRSVDGQTVWQTNTGGN